MAHKFCVGAFGRASRFVAIALCALAAPFASASVLWFASGGDTIVQVDTTTNTIGHSIPLPGVRELAVDGRGAVWAVTNSQVMKFGGDGSPLYAADLQTLGLNGPTIATDPYDASAWLVDGKKALHLDQSGQALASFASPFADVRQVQVGLDQGLWLLGNKQVAKYFSAGTALLNADLHALTAAEPQYFLVDSIGGALWFAGGQELTETDPAATQMIRRVATSDTVVDLALQPTTGLAWFLTKGALTAYDPSGAVRYSADLQTLGVSQATAITYDASTDSLWVTYQGGVARFSAVAALLAKVPTQKAGDEPGAAPFVICPQLTLLQPTSGTLTNNPQPSVILQYGVSCSSQSCGVANSYLGTYLLSAILNGQSVANLFTFGVPTGTSIFAPSVRLPEGVNTFSAQERDMFGHLSNQVTSSFTIDTIPPKFLNLSPPDGSTFTTPQVTVSGSIDEPGQVLLANLADFGGTGTNSAGMNFTYGLTLKPGPNAVRLLATDLAGNASTATLNLTLLQQLIDISVDSPLDGAMVDGNSVVVTGTFRGAPTVGINVNGVVAAIVGSRFFASVPLQIGPNVLTVAGSALGLPSTTKTLTVTGAASPFFVSVSPENGIAPHAVTFTVFGLNTPIARIDVDFTGSGVIGFTTTDPTTLIQTTYSAPGVYQPTITVTDAQGGVHTYKAVVSVANVRDIDAQLRALYSGMMARLKAQDVSGALQYFTPPAADRFRGLFQEISSNLPSVVDQFGTIVDGNISDELAEYVLVRQKSTGNQGYLIYFMLGYDGLWRIAAM